MAKLNDILFSDIYIMPDKKAYISDGKTQNGLAELKADDYAVFAGAVEQSYNGKNPSYSVLYDGIFYRIERSVSVYGAQYCGRKMPPEIPAFNTLGFPPALCQYLLSLSNASGLILWT